MNLSGGAGAQTKVYSSKLLIKVSNPLLLSLSQHNESNQNSKILPNLGKIILKKSLNSEYNMIWGEKMQRKRKNIGNTVREVDRMKNTKGTGFLTHFRLNRGITLLQKSHSMMHLHSVNKN